jgi:hypothetical protein
MFCQLLQHLIIFRNCHLLFNFLKYQVGLYDLVGYIFLGYTYNFFGILKNAGEYSIAAKDACFALIGVSEVNIENTVGQSCIRNEQDFILQYFDMLQY